MKQNFNNFISELIEYIDSSHQNICFFGYGSCFNHWTENPKDIDGGFIAKEIITNKEQILNLSGKLTNLMKKYGLSPRDTQFNLMDLESGIDGRFLSYGDSYISHFLQEAKILSGKDYLSPLKGIEYKKDEINSLAFNFRKVRNAFLYSECHRQLDDRKFKESFEKVISALSSLPKQLEEIKTKNLDPDKLRNWEKQNLQEDERTLINQIFTLRDKKTLENFVNTTDLIPYFASTLTLYEKLIRNYIQQNPPRIITIETII